MNLNRVVISGGGTGGHIFPAIAIADEIKRRNPDTEILFVGANGKMEMEKVPAAGYKIVGLNIVGFQRKLTLKNFLLPFKIIASLLNARKILKEFKPQVVIGVGGFASGPTLQAATYLNIPTLVQEQNSFPGKTNKILSKKVTRICTAYEGLDKFFPASKIVETGNPVRSEMVQIEGKRQEALEFYGFDSTKQTILIIGGSLGARTLNESVLPFIKELQEKQIQVLWQCGSYYYDTLKTQIDQIEMTGINMVKFINRMDLAYAMADVVISRAGAISVSELCLIQKPTVLVPSPNVAEDHQTKNAMALVNKNAAILVKDVEAVKDLIPAAISLTINKERSAALVKAISKLGKPNATVSIVDEIEKIVK
ncbi:MAG: undecaprenyldiphospho-muramoylpentapeptide beta-N-acetylglucosaminyltransferase [Flavobacteriia bacterium]|nr:undecaprenyldiphospho-muramoylpentapeptide beta-N-acetylglucosaminyltransferase [Flavobacteriia bacterium]